MYPNLKDNTILSSLKQNLALSNVNIYFTLSTSFDSVYSPSSYEKIMAGTTSHTRTRITTASLSSANLIEAEISNASARLAYLQYQQQGGNDVTSPSKSRPSEADDDDQRVETSADGTGGSNSCSKNNNTVAVSLIRRARELQDQIQLRIQLN